jgi:NitT/TauT family transport system substrate-binding protein
MKLICALSQGMYWFLVMRADIARERGDIGVVRGRRIAAAPWVELGLRRLLIEVGIDPAEDDVRIAPLEGSLSPKVNIGVTVAHALAEGKVDGFWANGMGAELAVMSGAGKIVLDVRRGDGPKVCFDYTLPTLAASDRLIESNLDAVRGAARAIAATLRALKEDVSLATKAARNVFPEQETELIAELIRRDLPFYDPMISERTVAVMNQFCRDMGVLQGTPGYTDVVAADIMTSGCKI